MFETNLCENTESKEQHIKFLDTPKGGGGRKRRLSAKTQKREIECVDSVTL